VDGSENVYVSGWQSTSTFDASKVLKMTLIQQKRDKSASVNASAWNQQISRVS
jgi:hypothetical protein